MADCRDNGLSSSEGLRGRGGFGGRGGLQAFRALPPNTSLVGWGSVRRVHALQARWEGRGGTFPAAAYGLRQGAGTERSTIWAGNSRPATQPPSDRVPPLPAALPANLGRSGRQASGSSCLPPVPLTVLGTGRRSAVLRPLSLSRRLTASLGLPSPL